MYERVFRLSAERSAVAGVFAAALALCVGMEPAAAQGLGRPSVVVDESVLDQLGPPPQTLPDVLLQQQPQNHRPAKRVGADAAAVSATPGRLLPPPKSMPRSRVMLPSSLQSATPENSPAAQPQAAHAPKLTPPKTDRSEPPSPPPVATVTPAPATVPPAITPPKVSVPEAPSVAPPPAVAPTPEAAASASPEPASPAPPEQPAAKAEAAETPPETPTAPPPGPASVPKLVPPAPIEAAKAVEPKPEAPPLPEAASIPKAPAVEPPPPPAASATPPAPLPSVAGTAPSPRTSKPAPDLAPDLAVSPPQAESRGDGAGESPATPSQIAALPPAAAPEVLDDGQLYRIPFGSVSSEISDEGKKHLDALAQRMKKDDALRLQLLGYAAGSQDSASKARRTSLFRALSVRTYLMKQGVRSTRMDVRALGNLAEGGAPDRVDAVVRK